MTTSPSTTTTRRWPSLKSISDFVDRPDIVALPGLAKRHDFDEFVVDSLTSYVQGEIDKSKIDTATLLQAANQFTILRQRVSEAQDLLKAGKTAGSGEGVRRGTQPDPRGGHQLRVFRRQGQGSPRLRARHGLQAQWIAPRRRSPRATMRRPPPRTARR